MSNSHRALFLSRSAAERYAIHPVAPRRAAEGDGVLVGQPSLISSEPNRFNSTSH